MEKMMSRGCALCLQDAPLLVSHILPAFVFKWLKNRSTTKFIRDAQTPNRRTQDGAKVHLLCASCEQAFDARESLFSSQAFYPILNGAPTIQYDRWMLYFCTSVSWRILKHLKGISPEAAYTSDQEERCIAAEARWRRFLLGGEPHPGAFEQHLMVFTEIHDGPSDLPQNINRYLLGPIEMNIIGDSHRLMTFAKLGRFAIFGHIQGDRSEWVDTKVHVRDGWVRPGRFSAPQAIGAYLASRAVEVDQIYDSFSPSQRPIVQAAMDEAILRDPEGFLKSDHGRSIMADARLFGESAVKAKS